MNVVPVRIPVTSHSVQIAWSDAPEPRRLIPPIPTNPEPTKRADSIAGHITDRMQRGNITIPSCCGSPGQPAAAG
jgi:hypothetical protein